MGFAVVEVRATEDGRLIWIRARDRSPDAFRPNLQVTDAWDDANECWSFGFRLSEDGAGFDEPSLEYDGARVNIAWLCEMIEAAR